MSGNHEEAAFSPGPPTSSQNPDSGFEGFRGALYVAWAFVSLLWVSSHGALFIDEAAFERLGRCLDSPLGAWSEVVFGYLGISYVAEGLRRMPAGRGPARHHMASSVMALCGYGIHLYVLRWPWLSGSAPLGSRLDRFAAILSSTWHGVPVLAFCELLSVLAVVVQGTLGLSLAGPYLRLVRAQPSIRRFVATLAMAAYAAFCGMIIALATGRH